MYRAVSDTGHLTGLDRLSHVTRRAVSEWKEPLYSHSVVEATVAQLLVDSLADARHVLLTEQQGLLHRETAAVLTDQDRKKRQWGKWFTTAARLPYKTRTLTEASLQRLSLPWRLSNDHICVESWGRKDTLETQLYFISFSETYKAKRGGRQGQETRKRNKGKGDEQRTAV